MVFGSTVTQTEFSPGVIFIYTTPMSSLEDSKEQERKNLKLLMQLESLETQQKVNLIKERLKAIEGNNVIRGMDATKINLVPNVVIPYKCKIPDFVKYDGTTCRVTHITMYCQKIVEHTRMIDRSYTTFRKA